MREKDRRKVKGEREKDLKIFISHGHTRTYTDTSFIGKYSTADDCWSDMAKDVESWLLLNK